MVDDEWAGGMSDAAESEQLAELRRHAGEARARRLGLEAARQRLAQELTLADTELAAARALEDIFAASVERLAREEQEEKEAVARMKARAAAAEADLAAATAAAAVMERRLAEEGTAEEQENCQEAKNTAEEREKGEEARERREVVVAEGEARVQAEAAAWEPGSLGGGAWEVAAEVGSGKHMLATTNPRFLRLQRWLCDVGWQVLCI